MYLQMNENAVPRVHGMKGVKRAGDNVMQLKPDVKKTRNALGDITNVSPIAKHDSSQTDIYG